MMIRPRTVTIGAGLMVCVRVGALIAQLRILWGDVIQCPVLGTIAAFVAWSHRLALGVR